YCPEALANTLEVADRCNLELEFNENHLEKFGYEKETIGFFLTGHPLDGVIETIRMVADMEIAALENAREGQAVRADAPG
ncbi:MAG: hypothetical protein D3910_29175, partial [Candidatus Electrothrix sp. ATG2]|nr:hypothetical protein [Candidatus Electrothrix sp. ATG2]